MPDGRYISGFAAYYEGTPSVELSFKRDGGTFNENAASLQAGTIDLMRNLVGFVDMLSDLGMNVFYYPQGGRGGKRDELYKKLFERKGWQRVNPEHEESYIWAPPPRQGGKAMNDDDELIRELAELWEDGDDEEHLRDMVRDQGTDKEEGVPDGVESQEGDDVTGRRDDYLRQAHQLIESGDRDAIRRLVKKASDELDEDEVQELLQAIKKVQPGSAWQGGSSSKDEGDKWPSPQRYKDMTGLESQSTSEQAIRKMRRRGVKSLQDLPPWDW
jgi:hypothetical protein